MPDSGPDAGPILVTGIAGQLASALAERASVRRVGRPAFDFDRPDTIETCFRASRPRLVINAAAYTAVDAAEADPEAAYRGNCEGPAALADLCAAFAVPFIHVSTDYVFDGLGGPYVETLAQAMAEDGILFIYGSLSNQPTPYPHWSAAFKNLSLHGWVASTIWNRPNRFARGQALIRQGLKEGRLKPVIDRTFRLEEIVEAHRYLESNQQVGKIVVTV